MVHYNKLVRRINREEELFHVKDYYVKLCYSYMELVKVNLYYVYTMEVVQMIYHVKVEVVKMIYHVEVYHVEVYCEVDYYKVDNWVQKVEILVLGKMMGNVTMVDGFAGSFLSQLGEGHVVQEEDDILEERFPFLNLRSRDVADTASLLSFWTLGSTMRAKMVRATARKAWSCYYWWRIQPIEMDHAVWPSVGMEN